MPNLHLKSCTTCLLRHARQDSSVMPDLIGHLSRTDCRSEPAMTKGIARRRDCHVAFRAPRNDVWCFARHDNCSGLFRSGDFSVFPDRYYKSKKIRFLVPTPCKTVQDISRKNRRNIPKSYLTMSCRATDGSRDIFIHISIGDFSIRYAQSK